MYKLLQKELLCDLNFIINDVKLKAHCAIVSCRSSFLKKRVKNAIDSQIINNNCTLQHPSCGKDLKPLFIINNDKKMIDIKITESNNPDAFRIVLECIYTDCIISIEGKGKQTFYID